MKGPSWHVKKRINKNFNVNSNFFILKFNFVFFFISICEYFITKFFYIIEKKIIFYIKQFVYNFFELKKKTNFENGNKKKYFDNFNYFKNFSMNKIKFKKLKKQKSRNICNMVKTWQCNNFFFSKFIHPKVNQ